MRVGMTKFSNELNIQKYNYIAIFPGLNYILSSMTRSRHKNNPLG
jgi:hypothetical protein